ncbi:MAG: biopolymer transporter ExbD [Kiritimatiellae bacterium]|nr:biopolymer transporter ExbD [Kiritimatiellia bacterium]
MARERKRPQVDPPALSMTPMIDVVFQLLIYFVVTLHPVDVVTNLDVFQPAPPPDSKPEDKPPQLLRVSVFADGYTFNDTRMSIETIDRNLQRFVEINQGSSPTVMVVISAYSRHGDLVRLLDICAKHNITSISVVSAPN